MLYRIQRFGIKQTSKMAGIVYFVLGIVLIPVFYVVMMGDRTAGGAAGREAFNPATLLMLPAVYGLIGYLTTALILFIYNRVARNVGGVELDIVYAVAPPSEHGAPSAPSAPSP